MTILNSQKILKKKYNNFFISYFISQMTLGDWVLFQCMLTYLRDDHHLGLTRERLHFDDLALALIEAEEAAAAAPVVDVDKSFKDKDNRKLHASVASVTNKLDEFFG